MSSSLQHRIPAWMDGFQKDFMADVVHVRLVLHIPHSTPCLLILFIAIVDLIGSAVVYLLCLELFC